MRVGLMDLGRKDAAMHEALGCAEPGPRAWVGGGVVSGALGTKDFVIRVFESHCSPVQDST